MCFILRSSQPLVPITSSVSASDKNGKEKEKGSVKHPENIASIDLRSPHTTLDPNFGTEVRKNRRKSGIFVYIHCFIQALVKRTEKKVHMSKGKRK